MFQIKGRVEPLYAGMLDSAIQPDSPNPPQTHRSELMMRPTAISLFLPFLATGALLAAEVQPLLNTIRQVGPLGAGHREATAAWKQLSQSDISQLTAVLAGIEGANPLAANWIRSAAETIADRQIRAGQPLPLADLEKFLLDTKQAPRARRMAYEWLVQADAQAPDRLIPGLLNDPSVEFRRDAVARLIEQADPLFDAKQGDEAAAIYQRAFHGARDLDQIQHLTKRLRELKQPIDLQTHFGFISNWRLIGPFDNADKKGFAVAYPPERVVDFMATYEGKAGSVTWIPHQTPHDYGMVDFNKAIGKHMGVAGYAAAEYESAREQTVELRLGSANANKLWLNGKLIDEHEVYHAGTKVDQYMQRVTLQPGKNVILVKVCQNEQKDDWAQTWQFQLRVCDATGTAILAANRPATIKNEAKESD